jgi:hypothetical protein
MTGEIDEPNDNEAVEMGGPVETVWQCARCDASVPPGHLLCAEHYGGAEQPATDAGEVIDGRR